MVGDWTELRKKLGWYDTRHHRVLAYVLFKASVIDKAETNIEEIKEICDRMSSDIGTYFYNTFTDTTHIRMVADKARGMQRLYTNKVLKEAVRRKATQNKISFERFANTGKEVLALYKTYISC